MYKDINILIYIIDILFFISIKNELFTMIEYNKYFAYFLGFLWSDGFVERYRENRRMLLYFRGC